MHVSGGGHPQAAALCSTASHMQSVAASRELLHAVMVSCKLGAAPAAARVSACRCCSTIFRRGMLCMAGQYVTTGFHISVHKFFSRY